MPFVESDEVVSLPLVSQRRLSPVLRTSSAASQCGEGYKVVLLSERYEEVQAWGRSSWLVSALENDVDRKAPLLKTLGTLGLLWRPRT